MKFCANDFTTDPVLLYLVVLKSILLLEMADCGHDLIYGLYVFWGWAYSKLIALM